MSSSQGRLPASVYRRRRIVVGLGALAVVLVIVLLIVRPGAADEGTKPAGGTSSETPSADPQTPSQAPADPSALCDPGDITVTPVADATEYRSEQTPMVSLKIVNSGVVPCSFDVGTGAQEYLIMSGSDRIWSSRDCQKDPASLIQVLEPGVELETTPIPWDRTRSAKSTCDEKRPAVVAGGATYRLSVSVGEAKSEGDVPFLLY